MGEGRRGAAVFLGEGRPRTGVWRVDGLSLRYGPVEDAARMRSFGGMVLLGLALYCGMCGLFG